MNKIKYLREKNNMTQEKLGELIGVKSSAVSKYEKNIVPLTDETLLKLSKIFGVSCDYIIGNNKNTSEEEEIEALKSLLIKNGFMSKNEDLTEKELDKLFQFVNANKEFLKDNK